MKTRIAVAAALLGACAKDPTQIVVYVDSNIAQLARVHAVVIDDDGEAASEHDFLLPADVEVPFSFGVGPGDGPKDQRVIVLLEGFAIDDGKLVSRRAVTYFVKNKTLLLPMYLAERCIGVTCEEVGFTCTENGCEDEQIDPNTLQEIEPGGEVRVDGGVADGGVEQGMVLVEAMSDLHTTEGGGTTSFTVRLDRPPTTFVGIALASSEPAEAIVAPALITFTPLDWEAPKTVMVTGLDDPFDDGDQAYLVTLDVAEASDPIFRDQELPAVSLVNDDDEASQIVLLGAEGLSTTERGGEATFSIALASQPQGEVVLELSSSDVGEGVVSTASVAFTPADWDAPREVRVVGVDDPDMDGPATYVVTIDPRSSPDGAYAQLDPLTVSIINSDDESPGITVSPTALLTTEAGGEAEFSIALNTAPTATVTVRMVSSNDLEGSVVPGAVSFTPSNWETAQMATVRGNDDKIVDGNVGYTIVLEPAVSADPDYGGADPSDVAVANVDDDSAGIEISPFAGLVTSERGDTATFQVRLTSEPARPVTIAFSTSNAGEGTVAPAQAVFTDTDYALPQTFTVTGADDGLSDGPTAYTIISAPAVSDDPIYQNLDPIDVSVSNADDDSPGITVSPTAVTTSESGAGATFSIRLTTMPTADVTIALSSSDTSEATVAPTSITIPPANWNTAYVVMVSGVDDPIDDGTQTFSIVIAPASSSDLGYSGIDAPDVTVTNQNDDFASVQVTQVGSPFTFENGVGFGFTVNLDTQPTDNVTIGLSTTDTTEGVVSSASLTFTPANWSTAQPVNVTGVDDLIDDDNVPYIVVTAPAVSNDVRYNNLNPPNIAATSIDDDTASFIVSPWLITTREVGTSAQFTVRLGSQPTASVPVDVVQLIGGAPEVTLQPVDLIFNGNNWSTPQTVNAFGLDDGVLDGDRSFLISLSASGSQDPVYASLQPGQVFATNTDDGFLPPTLISAPLGGNPSFTSRAPAISGDGRIIVFASNRSDLVGGDTNNAVDIFAFDRGARSVTRLSLDSIGLQGASDSLYPVISTDGRFVAFESIAANLVPGDNNGVSDVFVRDRTTGTTTRVSVTAANTEANTESREAGISADGRFVSFYSDFSFDSQSGHVVHTRDLMAGTISGSGFGNSVAIGPHISANGRWVLFAHDPAAPTLQLYDRVLRQQAQIGSPDVTVIDGAMNADAALLAYSASDDPNNAGDQNGFFDVFAQDNMGSPAELISVAASAGQEADGQSTNPSISDDGRFVAFISAASNLTIPSSPPPGGSGVFVRDRLLQTTTAYNVYADDVLISADGRFITYTDPGPPSSVYLMSR